MAVAIAQSTENTTEEQLETYLASAQRAFGPWAATSPGERANVLDAVGDGLDAAADELVAVAMAETNLPEARLRGELKRTSFQLRIFGELLRAGGYLDARIDHADAQWPMGAPRPDLRRTHIPLGPVVVFSASNFPFAFSTAGGDTASALAAGNPVIVKAHSGHLELTRLTGEVVVKALQGAGAPEGLFHVVFGTEAGRRTLLDPRIKAAGFTGSIPGGRALMKLAMSRPEPIPFYGELGSNNPVFVTKAAADLRGAQIAAEFVGSFSLNSGQFCTKPGTLFIPRDSNLREQLVEQQLPAGSLMLNQRIHEGFTQVLGELSNHERVEVLVQGDEPLGQAPSPTLLVTGIEDLLAEPHVLQAECFGPSALVVEYDNEEQLVAAAKTFEGQLTATLQAEETDQVAPLVAELAHKAGRVLWNQWPTGVSVTYAQQHGGPYPATTSAGSTSVGTAAIERFQRPVAFQNFPQHLLPAELQDANPDSVPQLVNGKLGTEVAAMDSTTAAPARATVLRNLQNASLSDLVLKPTAVDGTTPSDATDNVISLDAVKVDIGFWACSPGVFETARQGVNEVILVLEGSGTLVSEDGHRAAHGVGDIVVIPNGFRGTWHIHEQFKKQYITASL
ncbi:aldehyde dehydrogenase family protein [Glutamicibacter sp.]|uniref:aldehyde dehydrogenase family protein n=1 Tax=Glutamicibacter sp. TaxID=1931995 RepID=UPI0028BE8241|nr:aldehyde dehydrogenase family protein [Glutamicibacter sp.]